MKKFLHLLIDLPLPGLQDSLWQDLKTAGAQNLVFMRVDDAVAPAEKLRMTGADSGSGAAGMGAGPIPTGSISYVADKVLLDLGHTYEVTAHRPLPRRHHPGRLPGFTQLTTLYRKPGLSDETFHDLWLNDHRVIATETQANYYYHQYANPIPMDAAPAIDGIVEEGFPAGAMTDPAIFFDGADDAARFEANRARMMKSVIRFLDLKAITVIPMSAYCL